MDERQQFDADAIDNAVIALDRIQALTSLLSVEAVASEFAGLTVGEQAATFGALESIAAAARDMLTSRCAAELAEVRHA